MNLAGQILAVAGSLLMLVAAVGLLRLPDLFTRMHAATKAASLGIAFLLVGAALMLPSIAGTIKLVAAILFQFATAAVSAHIIGRAAYGAGVDLWEGTLYDDLKEHVERRDAGR